jgi:hypothetical protein
MFYRLARDWQASGMKSIFSYKDLTMIFGVMIAIIVMFTLWMRSPDTHSSSNEPSLELHKSSLEITVPAAKTLIGTTMNTLF